MRSELSMMLSIAMSSMSRDHLVRSHLARQHPNTNCTDDRDHQPRGPQRRLQKCDVEILFVVDRIGDCSANSSGLSLEKSEQSAPDVVHRRPHTDQVSGVRQKKAIDD